MLKTQSRPAFKLNYFQCKKGSYHDGQVLNYVCIQKNCNQNGLICSVCKNDHNGHKVIPLKYLLNTLKSHQQKPMDAQSFQQDLQEIQQIKNSFLYQLKCIVQKLSQKIQKIEEQIIQTFKKKKIQLLNQIELSMKFNQIIHQTLNNNITNQENFQKDFKTIASLIENKKIISNGKSVDDLSFTINLKAIVKQYENDYLSFSKKINHFLETSHASLDKILTNQNKPVQIIFPPVKAPQVLLASKQQYKFSTSLKGTNMVISNNNKTAECTTTSSQRFALIEGKIEKRGSIIRFKIQKLKNWIGLGLAIKNNLIAKNYHFIYNNIGHGSFLISNNTYSWSHAYVANNLQTTTFGFVQGNIVKLQLNQTQIIYTNQSQNKTYKLPILLNQSQWAEACFCANLCSAGDTVSIL